jgi:GNAT superfamily N-acetyltransferase
MKKEFRYSVKKAEVEDTKYIVDLLKDASLWLNSKGLQQWSYYLTDMDGNIDEITESIKSGHSFLMIINDKVAGTLTLEPSPTDWDREIWTNGAEENGCVYLHRFVIKRELKGKGIGEAFLDWAETYCKQEGLKKIRFDCLYNNRGLNQYYQERFAFKEAANVHGKHSKYEKILVEPRKSSD